MRHIQPLANQIKVGIMCRGRQLPTWQANAIRALLDVSGVKVALLIVQGAPPASRWAKLARLRDLRHLLWTLYFVGYVARRSRASRPIDLSLELADVPEIRCQTVREGRFRETFAETDLAKIRAHDLDLVLRFAFGILKGPILDIARYGVWSFHHGDERTFRGRPPCFWELLEDEPVVGSILQRLTERLDAGVVLHRGFFKATAHSYVRTRDEAYLGSADWPSVVCRALLAGDRSMVDAPPSNTNAPVRRDPSNGVAARFLLRQGVTFLRSQWRGLTAAAQWSVGVADVPISALLDEKTPAFDVRWLPGPRRSRYLADPFALRRDGAVVGLVEDYDYRQRRGVISAVRLDGGNPRPRTVIDAGVHASYPYLFEADGSLWCVPETYQASEIRLYRATQFPHTWELVATPVTGLAALDPTLVKHDDRWWLFCTDYESGPNTKLHIWHAENLTGPWSAHALNPVKTDVRSSRPAGTPFVVGGILYRPAQDGSRSYGASVVINRVETLTPVTFAEVPVATVAPPRQGRYRDGLHTLCAVGNQTVVDGRRDIFIPSAFIHELASRSARLVGRGRQR